MYKTISGNMSIPKEDTMSSKNKIPSKLMMSNDDIEKLMKETKLSIDEIFKLVDLYFNQKYKMYVHSKNSYDKFIEDDIKNFLTKYGSVFFEKITTDKNIIYKFEFSDISIRPPTIGNDGRQMFPTDARENNLTYASKLMATVTQVQEIRDIYTKELISRTITGTPEHDVPIATIPIMVRSKYCSLNGKTDVDGNECEYDPGCYFIVNGNEKVVISQERICENKPLVFLRKDSNSQMYVVKVNSRSQNINGMMQVMTINMKHDGQLTLMVPILIEFPVLILFRALGIESDREIIDYIVSDKNDADMIDIVVRSIRLATDDKGVQIKTQSDAINYLSNKIRVIKKYSDDKEIRQKQKKLHLEHLIDNNFLPHITGGRTYKAYFIGYMINKLLKCVLKRNEPDDRDSYLNKRVDLVGNLMDDLFRQFFRKMLNECHKYFQHRNTSDADPINIINQIRPNTIEQGLKAALLTGAWGKKKGVAQVLQRLTYLQAIEFFRRIDSPSNDAASSKLTHPRHVHATQNGMLCCVVGDTEVLLSDGITRKKIKDFTGDEEVLTVNTESLTEEATKIHSFFSKESEILLKITTTRGNVIKCTNDHKFLVTDNTSESYWRRADELVMNELLIVRNNIYNNYTKNAIIKIEEVENEPVYDFTTVSNNHSFIANGIVVHNCVETPEHAKVGLVKHLTILASVTVPTTSQIIIVKKILFNKIQKIEDINITQLINYTKIFLNGDWIGMTENARAIYDELKSLKLNGGIEATISIIYDHINDELRICCDGGRLFRPVICVKDNIIKLTKHHIAHISSNKTKSETMITTWEEFMQKNPGVIEYIDAEEQSYALVAQSHEYVSEMKKKELRSIDKAKDLTIDKTNRYGDKMFVKYSHCELHPSLLLGLIATNIPFSDHNQGPRNIFQYAQGRQAMCIYSSVYRYRLDTSFILYHPEKPLVNTRTSKYMYNDVLSPGENAVIAIGCYTGYSQEDSIVFNKSAIDRGIFRSTSYNKYVSIIQKNQSTSQDDIFMKPEQSKVAGMKHGSYEKMNEHGYVPEETQIVNGDFLIGKVTPINPTERNKKPFKDNSEGYKQHVPGTVDKVYSNIYNVDGYEMIKMKVRSERVPILGDKFCMEPDKVKVMTISGWKKLRDVTLEDKVATLVNGRELVYEHPIAVYKFNYKGQMYRVRSQQVDLDVTIDHQMYVKRRDQKEFELIPAKKIVGKRYSFKKDCAEFGGKDIKTIKIDGNNVSYNAFLELLGIFIADGCVSNNTLCIAGEKERKIIHIRNVCEQLKVNMTSCKNNDSHLNTLGLGCNHVISSKSLLEHFRPLSVGAINKYLPEYVWDLNMRQSRILLESMISCDGSHNQQGSECYYTSSKRLADDVMRLAIHAGWSGSIKTLRKKGTSYYIKSGGEGHGGTRNADTLSVRIIKTKNEPMMNHGHVHQQNGQSEEIYDYDGEVGCLEVPSHVFMIRQNKKNVWIGNCSRHGQKSTIGVILPQSDMPFTDKGITPDLMINPNAIPSRMTIGQLLECLLGKRGAILGTECDGTAFTRIDPESIKDELEKLGYNRDGSEAMYNGMTGQKMKSMIFIGPTYYQRLKHLTSDKVHSRSTGPKTLLVHQPSEGRARGGGMRIGEMERDALMAHGVSKYIKEKLMDTSDVYTTYVCDDCGLFAQRFAKNENRTYPTDNDVYYCPSCNNKTHISKVVIPYAFKLLIQELMSMCIAPRIRTVNDKYTH